MNKKKAEAYLKRKGKKVTEEEIEKVQQKGLIYGDPVVILE